MEKDKAKQEAGRKGGLATGPHKNGYFREMLEKYVFESEGRFATWVEENYTDAVKELGKLQPKNLNLGGDPENPIITEVIIKHVKPDA